MNGPLASRVGCIVRLGFFRNGLDCWWIAALFLIAGCGSRRQVKEDHPRLVAGVVWRDVRFYSQALEREMPYRVFLPQSATEGRGTKPLPVVYLLHGNGGGYRDWSNESDVARYAAEGAILVMPEGGSSYFLNAVERPKDRFEDYLTRDLVRDVEGRFPARKDRAGRAVIGVSMGGYAALKAGLSHPEEYGFVGAMSAPVDVPERRFTWRRAGQWWNFREIFGPMGSQERRARDVFALVDGSRPRAIGPIYLGSGSGEPLVGPDGRFAERLRTRGFVHAFQVKPGGHDWGEWNRQIPECFARWRVSLIQGGDGVSCR